MVRTLPPTSFLIHPEWHSVISAEAQCVVPFSRRIVVPPQFPRPPVRGRFRQSHNRLPLGPQIHLEADGRTDPLPPLVSQTAS